MSRWKAAGIHLSISALIGLIVLSLLFLVWYPSPYFKASGGQELTLILLGVDLVLGPLLTLVVFKAGKKSLKFDLSVIALLQLSALLYGLHVIVQARPAFIVAAVDRFKVVAANDVDRASLSKGSTPDFSTLSWTGPRLVAVHIPTEPAARSALMFAETLGGAGVEFQPEYYVDYATEASTLLARAKPLAELRKKNAGAAPTLDAWLRASGRSEADVAWVPISSRKAGMTMLLDARSGAVVDALDIDPW